MATHALATLGAIFAAVLLFSIPLILKFHVYKPEVSRIAIGDEVAVSGRISSVWCQAVDLSSDSSFQTFLYEVEPEVNEEHRERTISARQIILPNRAREYWGFHLLRGSRVSIWSCARLTGADLTVVKGYNALHRCLHEHRYRIKGSDDGDLSGEDSASESESDDVTSSISSSQGAVSNETNKMYVCKSSSHHVQLPDSHRCVATHHDMNRKFTLYHEVGSTDYYYYIFSSDTYLDIIPNELSVEFDIDRTYYDHSSSSSNCSSSEKCQLDISLASEQKIVVQMDGMNGSLKVGEVKVACKPREWLFCIFYAGFLIVIFLCAFQ